MRGKTKGYGSEPPFETFGTFRKSASGESFRRCVRPYKFRPVPSVLSMGDDVLLLLIQPLDQGHDDEAADWIYNPRNLLLAIREPTAGILRGWSAFGYLRHPAEKAIADARISDTIARKADGGRRREAIQEIPVRTTRKQ